MGLKAPISEPGMLVVQVPDTMDIFEGTEQIQQLVIGRAISGMRIE